MKKTIIPPAVNIHQLKATSVIATSLRMCNTTLSADDFGNDDDNYSID